MLLESRSQVNQLNKNGLVSAEETQVMEKGSKFRADGEAILLV